MPNKIYKYHYLVSRYQNAHNSTAQKIGKYTKYQRENNKYSLNEFARLSGLTPSFLLKLERGDYNSVKFDVIEKISSALHLSIEDFLRKCHIISGRKHLQSVDFYFQEAYHFPPEAIYDIKLFIRFLKQKYKVQIKDQKEAHKKYWEGKSK